MNRAPFRSRPFLLAGCLLVFVLSLWKYRPPYDRAATVPDSPESWHLVKSLVLTGHFSNPFLTLDTGPSAHLAPILPAFLALLTKLFGFGAAGAFAYKFAAAFNVSMLLALFPVFSEALGLGALTGFIAAAFWLSARLALHPAWEATYACIPIAVASVCLRRILASEASGKTFVLLGFLMGLLALMSPTCIPVFFCWLIWLAWRKTSLSKVHAASLILLPVLIVSPWIFRDYLVFDRLIPIRDNLGLELAVDNNDCATFGLIANKAVGCFQKVHPSGSLREAEKVLALGEPRYNDLRLREARIWIMSHPRRFLSLTAQRFVAFWLPHEEGKPVPRGRQRIVIFLMTGLSAIGLWIVSRRDRDSAIIFAIWLGVFPIMYYVTQFESRYRQPILWITYLLGALPLSVAANWLWHAFAVRKKSLRTDRTREELQRA